MMFLGNKKATFRGGISYHFKGMFNFYRSITSEAVVTVGFLEGEVSVFSAYNGKVKVINPLGSEIVVINPLEIK